ncbi:uncharacterized protein TNCV_5028271 [Trichonephila clavipes]|nr:uncharacterized protein TNCV_5028271 [Trichonephila clavipes]
MDLTQLKTQRKSLRTSFTLSAKVIEEELMKEVPDVDELSILKMQISDKFSRLKNFKEGQFKKIHEDESLPNEDKFQYLLQAVVSNSKAARLSRGFPQERKTIQKQYPNCKNVSGEKIYLCKSM